MPPHKNRCGCPKPPGGSAVCEEYQLAICRVVDGESEAYCVDPPRRTRDLTELPVTTLANWAISHVLGRRRQENEELTEDDLELLRLSAYSPTGMGNASDAKGNAVVFSLPPKLAAMVRALDEELGAGLSRELAPLEPAEGDIIDKTSKYSSYS